jgi:hypothetical protein
MRLAVLRLVGTGLFYAKEPESPVVLALSVSEPLHDLQLKHLAVAAPWNPVMIEAFVEGTRARIDVIEPLPPRIPVAQPKRRLRPGLVRRKRGFLSHD